jgi:signal transduction histidine kinase/ligand-binding sensor domain-containing protein
MSGKFVRKAVLHFKVIILFACFTDVVHAQQLAPEIFQARLFSITCNEGLSQGFVPCIIQDHRGFIWFATKDGLNKYDGYSFTVFRNDPENKHSVSDNFIQEIFEDSRGYLWISTASGINVFDPLTEKFFPVPLALKNGKPPGTLYQITEDSFGNIWGHCTSGYQHLTITQTKKENAISFEDNYSITPQLVDKELLRYHLHFEPDLISFETTGEMWITHGDSLFFVSVNDQSAGKITGRYSQETFCNLVGAKIQDFAFDEKSHRVIIATTSGISVYNKNSGKIEQKLPVPVSNNITKGIMGFDADGNLWVTLNDRLSIFNPNNGKLQIVVPTNVEESRWMGYTIKSILIDRNGIAWLGTNGYGVFKYNPRVSGFKLLDQTAFSLVNGDREGRIYLTTKQGIFYLDTLTGKIGEKVFADKMFLLHINNENVYPNGFVQDSSGIFWLNYGAGYIGEYDEMKKTISFFHASPAADTNFIMYNSKIWLDANQNPWITMQCGPNCYITHFDPSTLKFDLSVLIPQKRTNMSYPFISAVIAGKNGGSWIGSTQGLFYYSPKKNEWKSYKNIPSDKSSLSNEEIFSLCADPLLPEKYLWVGTNSGGLNRLDIEKGTFTRFTEKQGLPNNVIYGLLSDDSANIWLSTNRGLCRFNTKTFICKNYFSTDGLQGNEFNRYIYYKSGNGTLYFGGVNGLNYFKPNDLYFKESPPVVSFTGFSLFNKEISFGDSGSVISKPIDFIDELVLNYNQNVITINFAAMDFAASDKNQFKYQLKGFDKDLVFSETRHEAIYTGLNPGEYTLLVWAANSEGIWSKNPKSLHIIILPPWWKTWWAILFFILLIVSAIGGFILFRTTSLRKNQKRLEEKVRERTQKLNESLQDLKQTQKQLLKNEKLASFGQLTAGIAHEIKNPLNFITNFSELSGELIDELRTAKTEEERDEILENLKNNLFKIRHHGGRVDTIIKSMLNHSRTAGAIKQLTDMNKLCDEFANLAYHSMRANVQDFSCNLKKNLSTDFPQLEVIPQDMSRVILNLLNNAFYAVNEKRKVATTDYKPEVAITTLCENNIAVISVRDNGCGIQPEVMEKLFDPFFTTKPSGEGTGLGLSISYDIIHSHGGKMFVESKLDEFTEFTIRIPLKS